MEELLDIGYMLQSILRIIQYVPITLLITVVSMTVGMVVGLITALVKLYRVPVLRNIAALYVSFIRGTPLLVQMYLAYYGIPKVLNYMHLHYQWNVNISSIPAIVFVYIAFSINVGAYQSETIRAAIQAIDKGQLEAAYSIGMSTFQAMKRIVLPQALVIALPNFGNTFIGLLKDTSLAFIISVVEIMGGAKIIGSRSLRFFEVYIAAAMIYWGISMIAERAVSRLEVRLKRYEGGSPS